MRSDFDHIRECSFRARTAPDWRSYEAWDNKFHLAVASATRNKLLFHLFDHFSFDQHDAIATAIEAQDPAGAARAMQDHLRSVRERVLPTLR